MTYKEAINEAVSCIEWSELHIQQFDYGHTPHGEQIRKDKLDQLYETKVKLRKLRDTL